MMFEMVVIKLTETELPDPIVTHLCRHGSLRLYVNYSMLITVIQHKVFTYQIIHEWIESLKDMFILSSFHAIRSYWKINIDETNRNSY